jgi:hypothetical protein
MYLGLLAAMFVLAIAVMDAGYLETQLERPVSIWDYVHLAWLSSCLGAFAGALGSNFDDEDAVREATYSLRWHERRKMFDSYESGDADSDEQEEQERIEREYDDDDENDDENEVEGGDEGDDNDDDNDDGGESGNGSQSSRDGGPREVEDDRPRG